MSSPLPLVQIHKFKGPTYGLSSLRLTMCQVALISYVAAARAPTFGSTMVSPFRNEDGINQLNMIGINGWAVCPLSARAEYVGLRRSPVRASQHPASRIFASNTPLHTLAMDEANVDGPR